MTVLKNTRTGRYSTDADEVMTHVRKPVFVDNAIHHGFHPCAEGKQGKRSAGRIKLVIYK